MSIPNDTRSDLTNLSTIMTEDHQQPQNKTSYSTVLNNASSIQFPSKLQAILFNSLPDTKIEEYLIALGEVVHPRNILFSSRLSNNRICIYLSSESLVEKFMSGPAEITIKGENLKARKLITPNERLLLSGVCPSIPHILIENELTKFGLKLMSPLTFLRIGSQLPEFQHVLSFRRQTYIQPLADIDLPSSFLMTYDQTSYRIYLSLDKPSCFICKKTGHIAANCPNHNQQNDSSHIQHQPQQPIQQQPIQQQPQESPKSIPSPLEMEPNHPVGNSNAEPSLNQQTDTNLMPPVLIMETNCISKDQSTTNKRTISEINTTPSPTEELNKEFKVPTQTKKKQKKQTESTRSIQEIMMPTKTVFHDTSNNFNLTYEQTLDFFENYTSSTDPISLLQTYTTDIPNFIYMLTTIKPYFTEKSMKTKCTKLINKIEKMLDDPAYQDSDCSTNSAPEIN